MKQHEKLFIHDKPISFTLIGMFFLTIVVVLSVIHINNKQSDAEGQQEKEKYATSVVYLYDSVASDDVAQMPDLEHLDVHKGNVVLIFNAVVGNGYVIAPIHYVCAYNEPVVEELNEGRFPTDNEISHGRKCVVIGEGLKRMVEETRNGSSLKIDGISYDVIGRLKDNTGDGTDNRVFVFQNCLAPNSINDLDGSSSYFVEYGSNIENELETEKMLTWLHRFIPESKLEKTMTEEIDTMDGMKTMVQMLHQYTRFVLYGLFSLCILGCLIVTSVWMKRRKKELMIRKALGSDVKTIIKVLMLDISKPLVIALLLSVVFVLFQSIFVGELLFANKYIIGNLFLLFALISVVMLLVLFCVIYIVSKISIVEGTRE